MTTNQETRVRIPIGIDLYLSKNEFQVVGRISSWLKALDNSNYSYDGLNSLVACKGNFSDKKKMSSTAQALLHKVTCWLRDWVRLDLQLQIVDAVSLNEV